jgi:hypothetical protein
VQCERKCPAPAAFDAPLASIISAAPEGIGLNPAAAQFARRVNLHRPGAVIAHRIRIPFVMAAP